MRTARTRAVALPRSSSGCGCPPPPAWEARGGALGLAGPGGLGQGPGNCPEPVEREPRPEPCLPGTYVGIPVCPPNVCVYALLFGCNDRGQRNNPVKCLEMLCF